MLNPFINNPSYKSEKDFRAESEKSRSHQYAYPIAHSSKPSHWALWIGNLLIRMGENLTQGNFITKSTHENT